MIKTNISQSQQINFIERLEFRINVHRFNFDIANNGNDFDFNFSSNRKVASLVACSSWEVLCENCKRRKSRELVEINKRLQRLNLWRTLDLQLQNL